MQKERHNEEAICIVLFRQARLKANTKSVTAECRKGNTNRYEGLKIGGDSGIWHTRLSKGKLYLRVKVMSGEKALRECEGGRVTK